MDQSDRKAQDRPPAAAAAPSEREARLAQALRANLRRRKQAAAPGEPDKD